MKLGTVCEQVIRVILSMSHENCGYYGNEKSQNVAKTYRS